MTIFQKNDLEKTRRYFEKKLRSHPNFQDIVVSPLGVKLFFKTEDSLLFVKACEGETHKDTGVTIIYEREQR